MNPPEYKLHSAFLLVSALLPESPVKHCLQFSKISLPCIFKFLFPQFNSKSPSIPRSRLITAKTPLLSCQFSELVVFLIALPKYLTDTPYRKEEGFVATQSSRKSSSSTIDWPYVFWKSIMLGGEVLNSSWTGKKINKRTRIHYNL